MELFARSPPKKTLPFALAIGYWRWEGKKDPYIYLRYIEALARVPLFLCLVRLFRFCSLVPLLYLTWFYRENSERRPKEDRKNSPPTKSAFS